MEKRSDLQYMYMNGTFFFRFVLPNIPPSYWIQLSDNALLKIMREEGEKEISTLKKRFAIEVSGPCPNMCKIVTTYREHYKDLVDYYAPSNYEQYKRDIVHRMYLRDDFVIADPLHTM